MPKLTWMFTLLCVGGLLTTVMWYSVNKYAPSKRRPSRAARPRHSELCKGCNKMIDKLLERYDQPWKKQEANYKKLRSELSKCCNGFHNAIITQANTPVGTKIVYTAEKQGTFQVPPEVFNIFPKEHPFANKIWGTCAVVGNGGILANSNCGKAIDSAQFVMRCNLPPLENGYEEHVGIKTSLVTANPSIIRDKYGSLLGRRRPFAELLHSYSDSLVVFSALAHADDTVLSLRAAYTIDDFRSRVRPVFFNPVHMQRLTSFWHTWGLKEERLTTGFLMVSIALEVCSEVHLYGFWPFSSHPDGLSTLTNHYYDNRQARSIHNMTEEFDVLLQLHTQGVIKLHLADCKPGNQ